PSSSFERATSSDRRCAARASSPPDSCHRATRAEETAPLRRREPRPLAWRGRSFVGLASGCRRPHLPRVAPDEPPTYHVAPPCLFADQPARDAHLLSAGDRGVRSPP